MTEPTDARPDAKRTSAPAESQAAGAPCPPRPWGPVAPGSRADLRFARPYVALSFQPSKGASDGPLEAAPESLEAARAALAKDKERHVVVVCHGWHRNQFSGITNVDRMLSRFARLRDLGSLTTHLGPKPPIFLAVHWHSDPGADTWIDEAGRRHKQSFMALARERFDPTPPGFDSDFEELFAFMGALSAHDTKMASESREAQAVGLTERLHHYILRHAPRDRETPIEEKVSAVWACYAEATPKRTLRDQNRRPAHGFATPSEALGLLVGLLAPVVPLGMLLGLLPTSWIPSLGVMVAVMVGVALALSAMLVLMDEARPGRSAPRDEGKGAAHVKTANAGRWGFLESTLTFWFTAWLPLALFALWRLGTFVATGTLVQVGGARWVKEWLFDERTTGEPKWTSLGLRLAAWSRWAANLLHRRAPLGSPPQDFGHTLEKQLAFYEMQRRAVRAGVGLGNALLELEKDGLMAGRKVHLIGHSFGCVVVSNAARTLAAGGNTEAGTLTLDTLCLIQGALASTWFEGEALFDGVRTSTTRVTCVLSKYDTAVGFFYPFSNAGRLAAGHRGLTTIANKALTWVSTSCQDTGHHHVELNALSKPPELPGAGHLNIDASRLLYEGPLVEGGHNDIYKDDVVLLLWGVLTRPKVLPAPPASGGCASRSTASRRLD